MTDLIGFDAKIASDLEPLSVPIDAITTYPENVRDGNVTAIAESLAKYGQMKPLVVQESTGYIVAGNHTYLAAKMLGWEKVAIVRVDMDERTALGYLLADNRTSDLGTYHRDKLVKTLGSLADAGWLEGTLWSADDLDDLFYQTEAAITEAEPFHGTFAISQDELDKFKERGAAPAAETGAKRFREVPLLLREEDHRAFIENVVALEAHYGTSGKVATIIEAVRREAARINGPLRAEAD